MDLAPCASSPQVPSSERGIQSFSGFGAKAYMMVKPQAAVELTVQCHPSCHLSLIGVNHEKRKCHCCQEYHNQKKLEGTSVFSGQAFKEISTKTPNFCTNQHFLIRFKKRNIAYIKRNT